MIIFTPVGQWNVFGAKDTYMHDIEKKQMLLNILLQISRVEMYLMTPISVDTMQQKQTNRIQSCELSDCWAKYSQTMRPSDMCFF